MTDPTDQIRNTTLYKVTEQTDSVSSASVTTRDTGNTEKIEITNKGPNTVYFRTDGTTPTAGASGNADQLASGGNRIIEQAEIANLKMICASTETATVFTRLFT